MENAKWKMQNAKVRPAFILSLLHFAFSILHFALFRKLARLSTRDTPL
jgi:hypothetical protein